MRFARCDEILKRAAPLLAARRRDRDHTLYALTDGVVEFGTGRRVSVVEA